VDNKSYSLIKKTPVFRVKFVCSFRLHRGFYCLFFWQVKKSKGL